MAIAGLILSIAGLICGPLFGWIGVLICVAGIVLSALAMGPAKAAGKPTGMMIAGLVIGIVAAVIALPFAICCGGGIICAMCKGASALNSAASGLGGWL